jgi:hypothetical protein
MAFCQDRIVRLPRSFPPPWTADRIPGGFIVKDSKGQSLAYVYADNRQIVNSLTEDEARRIANNIAKLPELLKREGPLLPCSAKAQIQAGGELAFCGSAALGSRY